MSRSQSPNRFNEITVSSMAKPGIKELRQIQIKELSFQNRPCFIKVLPAIVPEHLASRTNVGECCTPVARTNLAILSPFLETLGGLDAVRDYMGWISCYLRA